MSSQPKEPLRNPFRGLVHEELTRLNPSSANTSVLNAEHPSATSHIFATSPAIGRADERTTQDITSKTGSQEILEPVEPLSTLGPVTLLAPTVGMSSDMNLSVTNYDEIGNLNTGMNKGVIIQQVHQVVDFGIQITLKTIKDDQLKWKVYQWLSPADSSRNFHDAYEILERQPNACSWFLNSEKFSQWLIKPGFLWIKGKSGCGKTILSSSIIGHLKRDTSLATAYFFFDGRDSQKELQLHDKLI